MQQQKVNLKLHNSLDGPYLKIKFIKIELYIIWIDPPENNEEHPYLKDELMALVQ